MIKNIVGSFLISVGKIAYSVGELILRVGHAIGTEKRIKRIRILEGRLANIVALWGIELREYGDKIIAKGIFISPKYDDYDPNDKEVGVNFSSTSDEEKDAVISCYVKKGGCEVQTGSFRRIDCK